MDLICHEIAAKYRLSIAELRSERRARRIAWPRQEAFWRAYKETTLSLPAIGRYFGGRDHTTIIHGIKAHEARLKAQEVSV